MHVDKLIVTNESALRGKYGSGWTAIRGALKALGDADRKRGLSSRLVCIDSVAAMKKVGGKAVAGPDDERGAKAAVDSLCRSYSPDYVLILGAPDVVPHVGLTNPMNADASSENDDDDEHVPSDLPYACHAPFSRKPETFLGPTRVVGRLPDVPGASDPASLVTLLGLAAGYQSRQRKDYQTHFSLSARVWIDSTDVSVSNLFGPGATVHTSPPMGPNWTSTQLAGRIHFINCHGNTLSPTFSGEGPRGSYFDALHSSILPGHVSEGTVVAAECCYGAEVYDPQDANGAAGICSTYLAKGAYGFFGSTNIAYGPAEGNGQADLICQYFVENVLRGASLGRAALESRQRFISKFSHQDPADLKTVTQFILLGDPSIHPVAGTTSTFDASKTMAKVQASAQVKSGTRTFRRERTALIGFNLARMVGAAVPAKLSTPRAVLELLMTAAGDSGIRKPRIQTYRVQFPREGQTSLPPGARAARQARTIHAAIGSTGDRVKGQPRSVTAIIATLDGRKVVHLRKVCSR